MTTENALTTISVKAAADLSAKQYCFVKVTADDTVNTAGDGEGALGVLQDDPSVIGSACAVGIGGVTKVKFGGTVAAGELICSNADGAAVKASAGKTVQGICLVGGASGVIGKMRLGGNYTVPGT